GNFLDHVIGGWYTSGIVTVFSGLPLTVTQGGQVWGGATSTITVNTAMIPTRPLADAGVSSGSTGCTLAGTGSVGTPAATGAGLNLFADPCAVYGSLRYVSLSADTRTGRANPLRGLPLKNFDMRVGKDTRIAGKDRPVMLGFAADLFNMFNY